VQPQLLVNQSHGLLERNVSDDAGLRGRGGAGDVYYIKDFDLDSIDPLVPSSSV